MSNGTISSVSVTNANANGFTNATQNVLIKALALPDGYFGNRSNKLLVTTTLPTLFHY